MAIRLTKQVWDAIRTEYLKGATATELAKHYRNIKAASIHARAARERWNELPIPISMQTNPTVLIHAKATGISINEASELEVVEQNRAIACHRAQAALLGDLLRDSLALASEAAGQKNSKMAESAAALIAATKEVAAALYLKVAIDRMAFSLNSPACEPALGCEGTSQGLVVPVPSTTE